MPEQGSPAPNLHAVGLVVEATGILILGASGSGKTRLALSLTAHCAAHRRFARLVADDQLWLDGSSGQLVASAPAAIAGLAEARGWRPSPLPSLTAMVVDLAVRLVDPADAPRYSEEGREDIAGVSLPVLLLPERDYVGSVLAICARLRLPPFAQ